MNCATCKHWKPAVDGVAIRYAIGDFNQQELIGIDDIFADPNASLIKAEGYYARKVGVCDSPLLVQRMRPGLFGASAYDAENYHAGLLTDQDFGCVNHNRDERPCAQREDIHNE